MEPLRKTKRTINPEMIEKLKELQGEWKYTEWADDHLLEKIKCHMTVFNLAMERAGSNGWDAPDQKDLNDLSYFWGDLHHNLNVAIEMLNMSELVLSGNEYNPSEKGRYLRYNSLNGKLRSWKEERE